MANFNQVTLVGRLTKDPEVKTVGEHTIANFSIAYTDFYKDEETAHFFDCEAFGKNAENIGKYLEKGREILVTGRLKQDKWEKDGEKRSKVVVSVQNFQFIGGGSNNDPSNKKEDKEEKVSAGNKKRPW